jgi:hypothetical protein
MGKINHLIFKCSTFREKFIFFVYFLWKKKNNSTKRARNNGMKENVNERIRILVLPKDGSKKLFTINTRAIPVIKPTDKNLAERKKKLNTERKNQKINLKK